jgi:hypothetical protein
VQTTQRSLYVAWYYSSILLGLQPRTLAYDGNAKLVAKAHLRNNMTLKDLLKKKDSVRREGAAPKASTGPTLSPDVPEFQFYRTTTSTQETIEPPSFPGDPTREGPLLSPEPRGKFGRFRSRSNTQGATSGAEKGHLAERLHFGRTRSSSSVNVPDNLPEVGGDGVARTEEDEANWEKRATVLVTEGLQHGSSQPGTPSFEHANAMSQGRPTSARSRSGTIPIGAPADEVCIFRRRGRIGLSYG